MGSRKKSASAIFTGAAAAGMTGFAAAPALATASTWTVTNGGKVTTQNSASNIFKDVTHAEDSFTVVMVGALARA